MLATSAQSVLCVYLSDLICNELAAHWIIRWYQIVCRIQAGVLTIKIYTECYWFPTLCQSTNLVLLPKHTELQNHWHGKQILQFWPSYIPALKKFVNYHCIALTPTSNTSHFKHQFLIFYLFHWEWEMALGASFNSKRMISILNVHWHCLGKGNAVLEVVVYEGGCEWSENVHLSR